MTNGPQRVISKSDYSLHSHVVLHWKLTVYCTICDNICCGTMIQAIQYHLLNYNNQQKRFSNKPTSHRVYDKSQKNPPENCMSAEIGKLSKSLQNVTDSNTGVPPGGISSITTGTYVTVWEPLAYSTSQCMWNLAGKPHSKIAKYILFKHGSLNTLLSTSSLHNFYS